MSLITSRTSCPLFINGESLTPKIAGMPVFNPSTGEVIAECPAGGAVGAALRRDLFR